MESSPNRQPVMLRKGSKTGTLRSMLSMLSLPELRAIVGKLRDIGHYDPAVASVAGQRAARGDAFIHGYYHHPIGPKTKGKRDASLRSRANRRKAA